MCQWPLSVFRYNSGTILGCITMSVNLFLLLFLWLHVLVYCHILVFGISQLAAFELLCTLLCLFPSLRLFRLKLVFTLLHNRVRVFPKSFT